MLPFPAKPASISGVLSPPRALLKFHFYSIFPRPAQCAWKVNDNISLEVCRPLRGQELPLATGPHKLNLFLVVVPLCTDLKGD